MKNLEFTKKSLNGLWVGDCIGNIGQLYYAHDILKALDEGIVKFGADNINPMAQQFQYSDDTEEAIVLVNHIAEYDDINQDKLAFEFAKRYFERDPDGEIYGYGLMTRKVLRDIYEGVNWRIANQTKPKVEGPSFVDKLLVGVAGGKSIHQSMSEVSAELKEKAKSEPQLKVGSCGNGSAMRVAPLGAFLYDNREDHVGMERRRKRMIKLATLQSEVTHCHPEGIAGAIAITSLAQLFSEQANSPLNTWPEIYYELLLKDVPKGSVWDGIKRASELPFETPIGKAIEILGNGTHVTCQDTVPLCCWLSIKALFIHQKERYEKAIIETCTAFGDVDTNCAIVGGIVGIISPPPEKWIRYCQPMEGVLGEPLPEISRKKDKFNVVNINKSALTEAMNNTKPLTEYEIAEEHISKPMTSDVVGGQKPPSFSEMIEKVFPGKTYKL